MSKMIDAMHEISASSLPAPRAASSARASAGRMRRDAWKPESAPSARAAGIVLCMLTRPWMQNTKSSRTDRRRVRVDNESWRRAAKAAVAANVGSD